MDVDTSGAKSAIVALFSLLRTEETVNPLALVRPGAPLGIYVGLYLAHGATLPIRGSLLGMDAQIALLRAESSVERDETFALLEEYGTVLQVDIIDTLNRSTDRVKTLDGYIRSLEAINERITQKGEELEVRLDAIGDERKEQRNVVRTIEREIRTAMKDQNFSVAGAKQEVLTKEEGTLAEIETREKHTKSVLKVLNTLLDIGQERALAITKNREILVAGLHVVDVPGISDLGLIIEE